MVRRRDGELHIEPLERVTDVSVGDWAVQSMGEWGTVACVVPAVFEDYARVFHPAWSRDPDRDLDWNLEDGERGHREVRWAQVAAANGRVAHPMEWASITGHWRYHWGNGTQPGLWDFSPEEGR